MTPTLSLESEYGNPDIIPVNGDICLTDSGNGEGSLTLPTAYVDKARKTRDRRWGATGILKIQPDDAGKVFINGEEYTREDVYIFQHLVQYYFFSINETLPQS